MLHFLMPHDPVPATEILDFFVAGRCGRRGQPCAHHITHVLNCMCSSTTSYPWTSAARCPCVLALLRLTLFGTHHRATRYIVTHTYIHMHLWGFEAISFLCVCMQSKHQRNTQRVASGVLGTFRHLPSGGSCGPPFNHPVVFLQRMTIPSLTCSRTCTMVPSRQKRHLIDKRLAFRGVHPFSIRVAMQNGTRGEQARPSSDCCAGTDHSRALCPRRFALSNVIIHVCSDSRSSHDLCARASKEKDQWLHRILGARYSVI